MNTSYVPNLTEVATEYAARIDAITLPNIEVVAIAVIALFALSFVARIVANEITFRNN